MTGEKFRTIAMAMPEASEGTHMGHADFRVGKRIFATLWEDEEAGMVGVVKLTLEQQEEFVEAHGEAIAPVKGGWGRQGYTQVRLAAAEEEVVRRAVAVAWENVCGNRN